MWPSNTLLKGEKQRKEKEREKIYAWFLRTELMVLLPVNPLKYLLNAKEGVEKNHSSNFPKNSLVHFSISSKFLTMTTCNTPVFFVLQKLSILEVQTDQNLTQFSFTNSSQQSLKYVRLIFMLFSHWEKEAFTLNRQGKFVSVGYTCTLISKSPQLLEIPSFSLRL